MISKRLLVAFLGLLFTTVGPTHHADASVHKISLDGTRYDDNGFVPMPQSCGVAQPGLCTFTGSGVVRWTGAVAGWSEYRAYAHYDPASGNVLAEIWERFVTARVGGCGLGSFLTHGSAVVDPRDQDPMTGGLRFHATWSFVDGTGTGDLAHVTSGRFSTDGAFELPTFANHGTIKGYLTCAS